MELSADIKIITDDSVVRELISDLFISGMNREKLDRVAEKLDPVSGTKSVAIFLEGNDIKELRPESIKSNDTQLSLSYLMGDLQADGFLTALMRLVFNLYPKVKIEAYIADDESNRYEFKVENGVVYQGGEISENWNPRPEETKGELAYTAIGDNDYFHTIGEIEPLINTRWQQLTDEQFNYVLSHDPSWAGKSLTQIQKSVNDYGGELYFQKIGVGHERFLAALRQALNYYRRGITVHFRTFNHVVIPLDIPGLRLHMSLLWGEGGAKRLLPVNTLVKEFNKSLRWDLKKGAVNKTLVDCGLIKKIKVGRRTHYELTEEGLRYGATGATSESDEDACEPLFYRYMFYECISENYPWN